MVTKKQILSNECVVLVAWDRRSGTLLGTGSVVFDVGAFADLVGEFGRLVVAPEGRGQGIGSQLMEARLAKVSPHLHIGLADNRVAHFFSQKISLKYHFAPVGYLPIHNGEPVALFARHFNESLRLRRNHPRVAPAIHWLADMVMHNFNMDRDAIADESSPAFSMDSEFDVEAMPTRGYTGLLRIERGRIQERHVFGPVQLHFGSRYLQRYHTEYLLAKRDGKLMGAIGYARDHNVDNAVRIFELIDLDDSPIRFLLSELERLCREEWQVDYLEIDVSADSPRLQKTLLELGFLPVAYLPAGVFQNVERLDIVRMARYYVPIGDQFDLVPAVQPIGRAVVDQFQRQWIESEVESALTDTPLFQGLNAEQTASLANLFQRTEFQPGQWMVREGQCDGNAYIILEGTGRIVIAGRDTGHAVNASEFVGEFAMLSGNPHGTGVQAQGTLSAAMISQGDLSKLLFARNDIGCVLYRNLARGLGEKLRKAWEQNSSQQSFVASQL